MNQTADDFMGRLDRLTHLGHAARNACFVRQVEFGIASGGTFLAKAAGQSDSPWANLMSLYRFLQNDEVPLSSLREIRGRLVLEAVPNGADVLVVHDLTLLDYTRHNAKKDRRPIGNHGGSGYEYAVYALIAPGTGHFLGVLHDTVISAQGPDDQDAMDYDHDPLFADVSPEQKARLRLNHRHQMATHIRGLSPRWAGRHPIHVADCEFDDIFVFAGCVQKGQDFVIRSAGDRNVQIQRQPWIPDQALTRPQAGHPLPQGWVTARLRRLAEAVPLQPYKSLPLDKDNRVVEASVAVRTAHLSIGSFRVRLYRHAQRNKRYVRPPHPVEVNVVVIRETAPPPGVEPLLWVLFTSLPAQTFEQRAYVGGLYERRWTIEEFFKLLKSGYRIEAARMDNATKTGKLLVILSLAAMVLLSLKAQLRLPATGPLNDPDYRRVKEATKRPHDPALPLNLRVFALLLRYGGWLGRKNDPIGPTVLMRGMLQLLATLHALTHDAALLHEAQENLLLLKTLFPT